MKMFFGVALKGGESETMDEVNADMVHLTQACLVNPKSDARCEIQVKESEGDSFTIAVLQKGATEALGLDLTFSPADPPTFVNKGKEEVHLTGCYEFYDTEEGDDESEEESSEAGEADMHEALNKELTRMVKEKAKQQGMEVEDSDEESDDDEEEGDEIVEELEEEEEEEEQKPSPKKAAASPKKVTESPKKPSPKKVAEAAAKPEDKKRKLSVDEASPKASKPAKAAKKDGNKVEDDYAKSIVEYLTKNGRTNVGQIGSKLRKPASVSKLSNFIKSRPEFKLSSGFIELA